MGFGKEHPTNWITAQSERPDILQASWALVKGIIMQGVLPPIVKQMIILKISIANNCQYCRVSHTKALKIMGVPEDIIDSVTTDLNVAQIPLLQREMLQFALKSAQTPQSVTDEDFQNLRDHGLNDGEIMELVMLAATSNFINTWADLSRVTFGE